MSEEEVQADAGSELGNSHSLATSNTDNADNGQNETVSGAPEIDYGVSNGKTNNSHAIESPLIDDEPARTVEENSKKLIDLGGELVGAAEGKSGKGEEEEREEKGANEEEEEENGEIDAASSVGHDEGAGAEEHVADEVASEGKSQ